MHNGSCLCGAVKYQVDAPIESATHCHCSQCRSRGARRHLRQRALEQLRWTAGEDLVTRYHSSPGVTRSFCRQCGATLQWYSDKAHPNWVSIALGTLDSPLGEIPQKHIYPESKADWYAIADGLPREPRS